MCLPLLHEYKIIEIWPGVQDVSWEGIHNHTRYKLFYIRECCICRKIQTKSTFWFVGKSKLKQKLAKLGFLNQDVNKILDP